MVGLILAIACANIANLLLARATARRREVAVRLSMVAGRWRVIRQLLTESLLLASLGGAAGILFAVLGIEFLTSVLAAGSETFTLHPEVNSSVLLAASLLTMTAGLLFGLAPALQSTHVDPMPALKEIQAATPRSRARLGFTFGRTLVISQLGICLLLLVGAGLFLRTLSNLQSLEMGFERENVLLFKRNGRQAGHRDPELRSFYSDLQKRFAAIPGVRSAAHCGQSIGIRKRGSRARAPGGLADPGGGFDHARGADRARDEPGGAIRTAVYGVCHSVARDRVRGVVRDDIAHGGAAHGRDRDPYGPRRAARNGSLDCAARCAVPCGLGFAISLPAAPGASKLVVSLLFGVKPGDPPAVAAAAAILFSAALIAGYLPARKASRIDPMTAVRHE
jgi:hypothetical protein